MAHRTAGGLPTNPGLHLHEKPPSWLTQIDWEPQLWLWMKHSSVSKKYDVSIGGSRLECNHFKKLFLDYVIRGGSKRRKSSTEICHVMANARNLILVPFDISRFFSKSQSHDKLKFKNIQILFETQILVYFDSKFFMWGFEQKIEKY